MFDTPITAKFFRKLDLYLELKRQNRRVKKSPRGERIWKMEKTFLLWAVGGHWYLGTPLTPHYIKGILIEKGVAEDSTTEVRQVAQNLVARKFAYKVEGQDPDTFQLTDTGFLMGEVIEDSQSFREYIYIVFSLLIWVVILWGFLEVLNKIIEVIRKIWL